MAIPKRLRMGPAAYITASARPLGNGGSATVIGWDMADIILDSKLSETGQHHRLFCELLTIVVERLRWLESSAARYPANTSRPWPLI